MTSRRYYGIAIAYRPILNAFTPYYTWSIVWSGSRAGWNPVSFGDMIVAYLMSSVTAVVHIIMSSLIRSKHRGTNLTDTY